MGQKYAWRIFKDYAHGNKSPKAIAAQFLWSLVEKIVLTPKIGSGDLAIDLYGDLAGILEIASKPLLRRISL